MTCELAHAHSLGHYDQLIRLLIWNICYSKYGSRLELWWHRQHFKHGCIEISSQAGTSIPEQFGVGLGITTDTNEKKKKIHPKILKTNNHWQHSQKSLLAEAA